MKLAVTGVGGFLGWHFLCAARAERSWDIVPLRRGHFSEPARLATSLAGVDVVVHTAGVNRDTDAQVEGTNVHLARSLTEACTIAGVAPHLVFTNSIQAGTDTPYGRGKAGASAVLARWAGENGAAYSDVMLPNLFGECGRPHYNSVVATFGHQLAVGDQPRIIEDREIELLHAQRACDSLIAVVDAGEAGVTRPSGERERVSGVLERMTAQATRYANGVIPDLQEPFALDLFNTLRSFRFGGDSAVPLDAKSDARGNLVEVVRADTPGQAFFSTTHPGVTRGNHFHRRKVERFVVLRGSATIRVRRLGEPRSIDFEVSGTEPVFVDMPTLHTHSITNRGSDELVTLFWSNEIFDPERPDTHAEAVAG